MNTGAIFSNAAQTANTLDVSKLVKENENGFPEIKKLNDEIQELRDRRQAVTDLLELSGRERMDGLKKGNKPLYDEIHRAVDAKERSIASRIWAGGVIAASVGAIGLIATAFIGISLGTLGTIAFPAMLALSTAASRGYLAASRKWLYARKEDALAVKVFKEYGQKFDEKIPQLEKKKADMLKRLTDSNQEFADAATGAGEKEPGINQDEDFIDIGGVKLKVNQRMDLITVPPVVLKKEK